MSLNKLQVKDNLHSVFHFCILIFFTLALMSVHKHIKQCSMNIEWMNEYSSCITSKKISDGFNIQVLCLRMFKTSGQGESSGLVRSRLRPTAHNSDLDVWFWWPILVLTWYKLSLVRVPRRHQELVTKVVGRTRSLIRN